MKKLIAKTIASSAVLAIALIPMVAKAVSYYPGYSCYYRDISGSCINYQTSNPYYFRQTRSVSPYGNRRSLNSFNAYEVQQSPWDNRYNNNSGWKYYLDDDNVMRPYYLERNSNKYYNNYYDNGGDNYIEYEHTRYYCEGRNCDTQTFRY